MEADAAGLHQFVGVPEAERLDLPPHAVLVHHVTDRRDLRRIATESNRVLESLRLSRKQESGSIRLGQVVGRAKKEIVFWPAWWQVLDDWKDAVFLFCLLTLANSL